MRSVILPAISACIAITASAAEQSSIVGAAATDGPGPRIEEILVTATKRSENVQTVPISVTAMSADDLERVGTESTSELLQQVPGLVTTHGTGNLNLFIRGVGSTDGTAGQEPSTSTYIDGVYVPASYGADFSLLNIERVEVLKGPQGTLFGRNATGGLVQVITKAPTQDTQLSGTLSYGNFDSTEAKLYATTGIARNLAADISAFYHKRREGFGNNSTTGAETNEKDELYLRSKWLYTPSENTSVTLMGSYLDAKRDDGVGLHYLPGSLGIDGVTTYTGKYQDVSGNVNPYGKYDAYSTAAHIEHSFELFSLKSISAYQRLKVKLRSDNDATPSPIVDVDIDEQSYRTFTQELQLISDPSSALKWIVGAFYMHDKSGFAGPLGLGIFGSGVGGGVSIANSITTDTYSAFGEATIPVAQATHLTLGVRYTKDKRELSGRTDIIDPATRDVLLSIPVEPSRHKSYEKPTWRAILDHQLSDDVMVYGSYSRGFKSGNFNTVAAGDEPFDPEILDAYEAGVKTELLDRRLRLNAALFYYQYDDLQVGIAVGPTVKTLNAADSDVAGAELETRLHVSQYLSFDAGIAYLDTEMKGFVNAPCYTPNPAGGNTLQACDGSGNRLPRAPKYTVTFSPTLSVPVDIGTLSATVGYYYNDGFKWDAGNSITEDSFAIVNANVGWTSADERWDVRLVGRNLSNTHYSAYSVPQTNGFQYSAAPPRTYGIEFGFKL